MPNSEHRCTSAADAEAFRKRIAYEDGLIIQRSMLIFTFNALVAVAIGQEFLPASSKIVAAAIVIAVDFMWCFCALEATRYIGLMSEELRYCDPSFVPIDELFRRDVLGKLRLRVTNVVAWTAILLFLGWVIGVILVLCGV